MYDKNLPMQSYTKQDISYIIQLLQQTLQTGLDGLQSDIIH
ncbi:hypothetical protein [Domibacillus robiginosus]|nr:hypothetical protein [Domibacillus robiginosus]